MKKIKIREEEIKQQTVIDLGDIVREFKEGKDRAMFQNRNRIDQVDVSQKLLSID